MNFHPHPKDPELHPKKWGAEWWICNNSEFCGKILEFNKGAQFSMHFHKDKLEVFYLLKGRVKLSTIDTHNAHKQDQILEEGQSILIQRLVPHQITALEDSKIIEFSTHHEELDSYRVMPGDSQK